MLNNLLLNPKEFVIDEIDEIDGENNVIYCKSLESGLQKFLNLPLWYAVASWPPVPLCKNNASIRLTLRDPVEFKPLGIVIKIPVQIGCIQNIYYIELRDAGGHGTASEQVLCICHIEAPGGKPC